MQTCDSSEVTSEFTRGHGVGLCGEVNGTAANAVTVETPDDHAIELERQFGGRMWPTF